MGPTEVRKARGRTEVFGEMRKINILVVAVLGLRYPTDIRGRYLVSW